MLRRSLTLLLVALAALALGACGNRHARTLHAATEGEYVDVGPLKYQVQISRLLNPTSTEDRAYLVDLPSGQDLGPADEWFAVFMRVENETDDPQPAAAQYEIVDTQDNVYRPIQFGPKNVFAYRAGTIGPEQILPLPDSPAGQNSIQGALLLFKIPFRNLENRPLELRIPAPAGTGNEVGTIDLDV
ncbi:MAG TPA: hypothetical protein VF257_08895 [Solirubrobacteraceae bacterium]